MAAQRELAEEIRLVGYQLLPAGTACGIWDGRIDRVHSRLEQLPALRLDNREIIGARLVPAAELRAATHSGPSNDYEAVLVDVEHGLPKSGFSY
jgi:8-oxo-dGTP diphosphatase